MREKQVKIYQYKITNSRFRQMDKELLHGVYSAIFSVYDEKLNVKKDTVKEMVGSNG